MDSKELHSVQTRTAASMPLLPEGHPNDQAWEPAPSYSNPDTNSCWVTIDAQGCSMLTAEGASRASLAALCSECHGTGRQSPRVAHQSSGASQFQCVFYATPSGKPYTVLGDGNTSPRVPIPDQYDDYRSDPLVMLPRGYEHVCPIRNCRQLWPTQDDLARHFSTVHGQAQLRDNLDGTMTVIGTISQQIPVYPLPAFVVVERQEAPQDELPPAMPAIPNILPHPTALTRDPSKQTML